MGLTSWTGVRPTRSDIDIAKNYLTIDELDTLNRIVTLYLDFAELQALNRKPMYMKDWISKLDEFLKVSDREILNHRGKVSHKAALEKAQYEYEAYRKLYLEAPSPVEGHFNEAIKEVNKIAKRKPPKRKGKNQ